MSMLHIGTFYAYGVTLQIFMIFEQKAMFQNCVFCITLYYPLDQTSVHSIYYVQNICCHIIYCELLQNHSALSRSREVSMGQEMNVQVKFFYKFRYSHLRQWHLLIAARYPSRSILCQRQFNITHPYETRGVANLTIVPGQPSQVTSK